MENLVSIIRLSLVHEVKYDVLRETDQTLTSILCLKTGLYILRMNEDMNFQDHLNEFNKLMSQLLNLDEKLEDEK